MDFKRSEEIADRVLRGTLRHAEKHVSNLRLTRGSPHACLIGPIGEELVVLPLRLGNTLVGRSAMADYVVERKALIGVVEGQQWIVESDGRSTTVKDAHSTNGSVYVPRSLRQECQLKLRRIREVSGTVPLGWDGLTNWTESVQLMRGDLLVNAYTWFLFWSKGLEA